MLNSKKSRAFFSKKIHNTSPIDVLNVSKQKERKEKERKLKKKKKETSLTQSAFYSHVYLSIQFAAISLVFLF